MPVFPVQAHAPICYTPFPTHLSALIIVNAKFPSLSSLFASVLLSEFVFVPPQLDFPQASIPSEFVYNDQILIYLISFFSHE